MGLVKKRKKHPTKNLEFSDSYQSLCCHSVLSVVKNDCMKGQLWNQNLKINAKFKDQKELEGKKWQMKI